MFTPLRLFFAVALLLTAMNCCAADTKRRTGDEAQRNVLSSPTDEIATMAAWVVPRGSLAVGQSAFVQVRLTPRIAMRRATLRLIPPDRGLALVAPGSFVLTDLDPERFKAPEQKRSPPNPPALGWTIVRTFHVVAERAGVYSLVVELVYDDKRMSRRITLVVD